MSDDDKTVTVAVGLAILYDEYGEHEFKTAEERDAYLKWYDKRHPATVTIVGMGVAKKKP